MVMHMKNSFKIKPGQKRQNIYDCAIKRNKSDRICYVCLVSIVVVRFFSMCEVCAAPIFIRRLDIIYSFIHTAILIAFGHIILVLTF